MLATVKGYYDGAQIVLNDDDRKNLTIGDELVITILNRNNMQKSETKLEQRRNIIDSEMYVTKTGRNAVEVDHEIKELRNNDRF